MTGRSFTVSPQQWAALGLVIARADGGAATHVVHSTPHGDAAITAVTADALASRRFITVTDTRAWPTDAGRRAHRTQSRIAAARRELHQSGETP